MSAARRWVRAPVAHFLAAGVALYLLATWWYERSDETAGRARTPIVVTQARLAQMRQEYERHYGSAPSEAELAALVEGEIDAEVLYREALARGLDRDDAAIRWRLLQKMRFVSVGDGDDDELVGEAKELGLDRDDVVIRRILAEKMRVTASAAARATPPSEAESRAYLEKHRDLFTTAPRVRFQHLFLSRDRRGTATEADAARMLDELRSAGVAESGGDAFPLGDRQEGSQEQIERLFGAELAARVFALEEGRWSGPIASPYGLHLVRVEGREPARAPTFAAVRDLVERRIVAQRVEEEVTRLARRLRSDYDVRIETASDVAPISSFTAPARAAS